MIASDDIESSVDVKWPRIRAEKQRISNVARLTFFEVVFGKKIPEIRLGSVENVLDDEQTACR